MRPQPLHPPRTRRHPFDDYEESSPALCTTTPFVCETNGQLSLHFELSGVQSLMDTADPDRLLLGYTRTILHFLTFHPNPRHIGMVGLGGGSLPKYCYRHLPETRISVAEISPEVIALRNTFHIPKNDSRFTITCEDGADFVKRHKNAFDVLIIDGFDSTGQPPDLCSQQFYTDSRNALTPNGTLVVNICDSSRSILIGRLRRTFKNRVTIMDGEDSINTIAFAGNTNA